MNLLVTGAFPIGEQERLFFSEHGYHVTVQPDEQAQTAQPEQYDAVICNGLFLYNDIARFQKLSVIQLTSAGRDRLPADYIRAHAVKVFTAADAYSAPMAEWAMYGLLSIFKNARFFLENQQRRVWAKDRNILELSGKHAVIYGFGNAGQAVARRLKAFDCRITAVDIRKTLSPYADDFVYIGNADTVLPRADIVIITLPLTRDTTGYFHAARLDLMKDTAAIVNIARGKLIDENALCEALKSGKFLGAALDVCQEEPLLDSSPLWGFDNVYITPHNSFIGDGNRNRLWTIIQKNLTESRNAQ
ncbi:MAG: hydroxyacid dehydrogenase [Clostridia bacterium]|nr:hydroxyacid dehydrogenase [Clostridia bacterium]